MSVLQKNEEQIWSSQTIEGVGVDNVNVAGNVARKKKRGENEWWVPMSRDASCDHEN